MDEEGLEYKYNFQIKKEQIKEMIGFSMTGLVIIPDNIFTQAEKESDYKKMFMIINVPKKNLTVSTRYIEEKLQQGKLDEAFCKLTIQGIDKKENVLNQMVVILVAIIILIFTMFITWLMLQNDQEHLKRKYQIGAILGVKRKEGHLSVAVFILTLVSIVTYWGQIGYTIPTALGIITAVIFTLFGCRLYLEKLRKRKNKYYKKILWLDNWYDQFFSHANISYIVSALKI